MARINEMQKDKRSTQNSVCAPLPARARDASEGRKRCVTLHAADVPTCWKRRPYTPLTIVGVSPEASKSEQLGLHDSQRHPGQPSQTLGAGKLQPPPAQEKRKPRCGIVLKGCPCSCCSEAFFVRATYERPTLMQCSSMPQAKVAIGILACLSSRFHCEKKADKLTSSSGY